MTQLCWNGPYIVLVGQLDCTYVITGSHAYHLASTTGSAHNSGTRTYVVVYLLGQAHLVLLCSPQTYGHGLDNYKTHQATGSAEFIIELTLLIVCAHFFY